MYNALIYLDPNKATGIDGIGPKILKYYAMSLFHPLCYLFNLSLSSGTIPSEWKIHLITPVYKSADRSRINNYRPISLLYNISKVLKSLIHDKIIQHVSTCPFLPHVILHASKIVVCVHAIFSTYMASRSITFEKELFA